MKKECLTPQSKNTPAVEQKLQRRGERNRNEPMFYGHNIMLTQQSTRKEEKNKTEKQTPEKRKVSITRNHQKKGKRHKEKNRRRENLKLQTNNVLRITFKLI